MPHWVRIWARSLVSAWPIAILLVAAYALTSAQWLDWQGLFEGYWLQLSLVAIFCILLTIWLYGVLSFRLQRSRRTAGHLLRMVEQSSELILVSDPKGIIRYVNPAFERSSGYFKNELIGSSISVLKSGTHDDAFYRELWQTITAGDSFEGVFVNRCKDGSLFFEDKIIMPIYQRGEICQYISSGRDISDRDTLQKRSEQLNSLAHQDLLTGLLNKWALDDVLNELVNQESLCHRGIAVAYIDLDGFVPINDAYGHKVGDQYLVHVAECLQNAMRTNGRVARLQEDEFVLVLEGNFDSSDLTHLVEIIRHQACIPVTLDGVEFPVRMSVGVALWGQEYANIQDLLSDAEQGMHIAKQNGGNRVECVTESEDYLETQNTPLRMI